MSEDVQDASTESKDRNSPPVLPSESPGSSVSTRLQDEYTELLKYAAGGVDSGTLDNTDRVFQPITKSGGSSSRHTPVDQLQASGDRDSPAMRPWRVPGDNAEGNENTNSIYPNFGTATTSGLYTGSQSTRDRNFNSSQTHEERTEVTEQVTVRTTIVEPAVTDMSHKLDNWLGRLKSDILAEFGRSTIQSLEKQQQIHQQQSKEFLQERQRLEREVNRLSELVNTCEESMSRKDSLVENLTQALSKQKDKVCMAQAFYICKSGAADAKREKFTEQVAANFHKRQITQKVLRAWFGLIQSGWRKRMERASQDQAQSVCLQLTTDYEEKIKSLNNQIKDLENSVKFLQQEREQYAEQVKKAFMRGVCALNMEAMSAFASEDNPDPSFGHSGSTGTAYSKSTTTTLDTNSNAFNLNNNLESSQPMKDDHCHKSLPAGMTITAIPDLSTLGGQAHSMPTGGSEFPQKSKSKSSKSKTRPVTAPGPSSTRHTSKAMGIHFQGQTLAPPMASVVVERHDPVTKQTLGKATASRYPKQSSKENSSIYSKHSIGSAGVSRSHPSSLGCQNFKPLAGQTASHKPSLSSSPSIKVVD